MSVFHCHSICSLYPCHLEVRGLAQPAFPVKFGVTSNNQNKCKIYVLKNTSLSLSQDQMLTSKITSWSYHSDQKIKLTELNFFIKES